MGLVAASQIHQNEIQERIDRLAKLFPDDVSRIDYRYGQDWSGDDSIYLTVHLTSCGDSKERFNELARRFPTELALQVGSEEFGLHSYFDFVND